MSRRKEAHSQQVDDEGRGSKKVRSSGDLRTKPVGDETSLPSVASGDPASLLEDPKLVHPANASFRSRVVAGLQRERGNARTQRLVNTGRIQAKLTVGEPDDEFEREADRVAREVSRATEPQIQPQEEEEEWLEPKPLPGARGPAVQRQVGEEEEEEEELMMRPEAGQRVPLVQAQEIPEEEELLQMEGKADSPVGEALRAPEAQAEGVEVDPRPGAREPGVQRQAEEEEEELMMQPETGQAGPLVQAQEIPEEEEELLQMQHGQSGQRELDPDTEARISRLRQGGQPINAETRVFFEDAFDRDFGEVRTHSDGAAAETAKALNARAFTVGDDIVFGPGEYSPGTVRTTRLLAHELTHVVQQTDPAESPRRASAAPQQGQAEEGLTRRVEGGGDAGSPLVIQRWRWPWSAPEGRRIVSVPEPEEETGYSPEIVSEPGESSYQPVSEDDWLALRQECYDTMHDAERLIAFLEERGGDDARRDRLAEISQSATRVYWAMRGQEPPFRASVLEQHRQRYDEIASTYEDICLAVLREIGGSSGPAEEEAEEQRARQLTSQQLDQIRQIIQGMDYGTVNGAYEEMDRWLGNQPGLSHIKMAWDGTKATVDSIVTATGMPANNFTRGFALFGKVISAKGHIDAFRNIVCARDVAEAREARVYFDRFVQGWHRNGWAEVMTRYGAFGSGQYGAISVGESEFMAMPSDQQAQLGVQIGQGAYGIEQRTMLSAAGAQILGALGDVATALWHVAEFIAGRLFPIYGALDFGTDVIQEIAEALSGD